MEKPTPAQVAYNAALVVERDSLLLTALLMDICKADPAAKDRMHRTLGMLSMENMDKLRASQASDERLELLRAGVVSAKKHLDDIKYLQWKLPSAPPP